MNVCAWRTWEQLQLLQLMRLSSAQGGGGLGYWGTHHPRKLQLPASC